MAEDALTAAQISQAIPGEGALPDFLRNLLDAGEIAGGVTLGALGTDPIVRRTRLNQILAGLLEFAAGSGLAAIADRTLQQKDLTLVAAGIGVDGARRVLFGTINMIRGRAAAVAAPAPPEVLPEPFATPEELAPPVGEGVSPTIR